MQRHLIILLILLIIQNVSSMGLIRLNITSTRQTSIRVEMGEENENLKYTKSIRKTVTPHQILASVVPWIKYHPILYLNIQVIDSNTGIDIGAKQRYNISINNNGNWNEIKSMNGLSINTKYDCSPAYFGSTCETICDDQIARMSRKRCDDNGNMRCDYGWKGAHCSESVDPRKCNCKNEGVCVSSISSANQLECECQKGFEGVKCEINRDDQRVAVRSKACDSIDVCLNDGQCIPNGPQPYCACGPGFSGLFCELSLFRPPSLAITTPIPPTNAGYTTTIYILSVIAIIAIFSAACFTYKMTPKREQAVTRRMEPQPYLVENKSMLINKDVAAGKVFMIEDPQMTRRNENEDRYTAAPAKKTYIMESEYCFIPTPQIGKTKSFLV